MLFIDPKNTLIQVSFQSMLVRPLISYVVLKSSPFLSSFASTPHLILQKATLNLMLTLGQLSLQAVGKISLVLAVQEVTTSLCARIVFIIVLGKVHFLRREKKLSLGIN